MKVVSRNGFTLGDRVKLSRDGLIHFGNDTRARVPYDEVLRGTVRGFGRTGAIRVQRDGIATTDAFAARFWERA